MRRPELSSIHELMKKHPSIKIDCYESISMTCLTPPLLGWAGLGCMKRMGPPAACTLRQHIPGAFSN